MKIQYCSDLHLEFRENAEYIKRNPIQQEADILLLAGDIVPFAIMNKHDDFFDKVSEQFDVVYWIPGNHEYYHSDLLEKCGPLNVKIRENVFSLVAPLLAISPTTAVESIPPDRNAPTGTSATRCARMESSS